MSNQMNVTEEEEKKLASIKVDPDDFQRLERLSCGKILGIDYGTKNVGLAVSDQGQKQAFVYDTLKVSENLFDELKEVCDEEEIDKIVVGLPLSMKGEYTNKTEEVVIFVGELEDRVKIAVEVEDERLSTVEGLKSGGVGDRDEEAARIILQRYLDRTSN